MGAWAFHGLAARLEEQAGIEVLPIELPGHNSRLREPLASDLRPLAARIASVVAAQEAKLNQQKQQQYEAYSSSYALLGHSMGAWLAFEVAQALLRGTVGVQSPCHLIVVANRAPSLCGAEHDIDPTRLSQLDGDAFWAAFTRRYGPNASLVRLSGCRSTSLAC
jgi:surfactin synthase thioesterase subunit